MSKDTVMCALVRSAIAGGGSLYTTSTARRWAPTPSPPCCGALTIGGLTGQPPYLAVAIGPTLAIRGTSRIRPEGDDPCSHPS